MKLSQHFDGVQPRERAGARSSDRGHYQKDWALCKILKLHLEGNNYLVAFDIHDDVVVFEPEDDPSTLYFYQIKTKESEAWTVKALLHRTSGKTGKLPSILGNLYHNFTLFPLFTRRLTLVSNAQFKIAVGSDGKKPAFLPTGEMPFELLPEAHRTRIAGALRTEHSLDAEPVLNKLLWFDNTDLPLRGHDAYTKGKLTEFFSTVNPSGKYDIAMIYKVLIDEIRRRNDYSCSHVSFSIVRQRKSLGKSDFQRILKVVAADDTPTKVWGEVSQELQAENVDFKSRQALRRAWQRVEVQRTDPNNADFRVLLKALDQHVFEEHETVSQTMSAGLDKLKATAPVGFDDNFIRAIVLMRIYNIL